jgi:hypothetical protein
VLLVVLTANVGASEKSPGYAFLSSMVVPGGGHFYGGNKGRGLFFFTAQTFLLSATVLTHQKAEDYRQRYLETDDPVDYGLYADYHNRRADLLWLLVGCYLFSAADAYVGAHFSDFEASPQMKLALLRIDF